MDEIILCAMPYAFIYRVMRSKHNFSPLNNEQARIRWIKNCNRRIINWSTYRSRRHLGYIKHWEYCWNR